jgi:hypothetical protein
MSSSGDAVASAWQDADQQVNTRSDEEAGKPRAGIRGPTPDPPTSESYVAGLAVTQQIKRRSIRWGS